MALRPWVRLPSRWIENRGLRQLRWVSQAGADNTAALMALAAIAHHADDDGLAKLTYEKFCALTGLSRAKLAGGLTILAELNVIRRKPDGRSTFQLVDYDRAGGWCKLPAKGLYNLDRIEAFRDFTLRKPSELHALKLYYLFASRRDNDSNMVRLSYDKIEHYSGLERTHIKTAISLLISAELVHVEQVRSRMSEHGLANVYRLVSLDPYNHRGTSGRGTYDADTSALVGMPAKTI